MDAHAHAWPKSSTAREDQAAASGVRVWLWGYWRQFSPCWIKPWALQVRVRSVLGVLDNLHSAFPAHLWGFPPGWVVPARLSMLFARCRDAVRNAEGRDALDQLPTGLMFLQETLLLGQCVGSCSKRTSPLCALTWGTMNCSPRRPGQCQGAKLAQKHQVEGGQLPPCWLGDTYPPCRCRHCGQKGLCHPSAMPTLPQDCSSKTQA